MRNSSKSTTYKGRAMIALAYNGLYNCIRYVDCSERREFDTFNVKLSAALIETPSNRITISIKSDTTKSCGGFTINAIGEADGFGGYDLFSNKEDYLANISMGNMIKEEKILRINITGDISTTTKGRSGFDCVWDLRYGLNVELHK